MVVDQIAIAPMLVALSTAILTLLTRRWIRVQQATSLLGAVVYAVAVGAMILAVYPDTILTYQLGEWPAPFGITIVADSLSAFMLGLTAVLVVPAIVFSIRYIGEYGQRISYHPLFHFMLVGVTGSFLTGDIFNMFVWFEVMLMASYVLVVFYSGPEQTRAALQYVVLNLVGSAIMLLSIGGIYATVGTLNMADLARRLGDPAAYGFDPAPVLGLTALLFAVFALKAGLVPFQFWVPAAYTAAPAPVTAMLAGVVKKVGVYAIVRLYFEVFAAARLPVSLPAIGGESFLAFYGPVLFLMATASIIVGGVSAIERDEMKGLLAYSSIGQVGFIVLPLAIAATIPSLQGLAIVATLIYALNHALAKGLLFLVAGAIQSGSGSTDFHDISGMSSVAPWLTGAFFVGGLALVGIPPLSGFFAKLLVFQTALGGLNVLPLAIALLGAILTIAYISRAWNRGFWGDVSPMAGDFEADTVQIVVLVVLALAIVAVGVGFDPIFEFANAASDAALSRSAYIEAVDLQTLEAAMEGGGHA